MVASSRSPRVVALRSACVRRWARSSRCSASAANAPQELSTQNARSKVIVLTRLAHVPAVAPPSPIGGYDAVDRVVPRYRLRYPFADRRRAMTEIAPLFPSPLKGTWPAVPDSISQIRAAHLRFAADAGATRRT